MEYINQHSRRKVGALWLLMIKVVIPVFLLILLVVNIKEELATPYEGYPEWALLYMGVLPLVLAPVIGWMIDRYTSQR